jgi:Ca2+-binding RTX toxin-like protein
MTYITVKNDYELAGAISKAEGGETILLAPGSYASLSLYQKSFSAPVTFMSLDASNEAKVAKFSVNQSSNVVFSNLDFGRALTATDPDYTALNTIRSSQNITLDTVKLHGSLDGDPRNDGILLTVGGSNGVTIRNSELTEAFRAVTFDKTSNIMVLNNHAHVLRSDGFDFASVQNVVIQGNRIGEFYNLEGDHPDAIQFWTQGQTVASSNITIRDNVVMQPAGFGSQGIFMRDEVGTMPYSNVAIENNLLYSNGGAWHGIAVNHVIGGRITDNTVVSTTRDDMRYWIKVANSKNMDVMGNITDQVILQNSTDIRIGSNADFTIDPTLKSLVPGLDAGTLASIADLVSSAFGYQLGSVGEWLPTPTTSPSPTPAPSPTPTPLPVVTSPTLIYGTNASETIQGTSGIDKISGVAASGTKLGKGTVDKLWGKEGADTFVLGDQRGVFYDDGNRKSAGRGDYAQIMDFEAGDKVQLSGSMSKYLLAAGALNGLSGTQIYLDTNNSGKIDVRDELIGHVVGAVPLTPDAFVFG